MSANANEPPTGSAAANGVSVHIAAPEAIEPGAATSLAFHLSDVESGEPITDVVVSHERPMHLIVVSRDLGLFQHVHPEPTGVPGEYTLDVTFPEAGTYALYADFARADGATVIDRQELSVGTTGGNPPALTEDLTPKEASGARVALHGAETINAGEDAELVFELTDARTGEPLSNLQPYLGAPAHVVIIDGQGQEFAHTHGETPGGGHGHDGGEAEHGGHAAGPASYGPRIAFHHTFAEPGRYKVWGQFQASDGQIITAAFVVDAQ